MPTVPLSMETLPEVEEGIVALAFNRCLARVVEDCRLRHGDDRARKVIVEVVIKPDPKVEGEVETQFKVKDSIPALQSKAIRMGVKGAGSPAVLFDPDLGHYDQVSIYDADPDVRPSSG